MQGYQDCRKCKWLTVIGGGFCSMIVEFVDLAGKQKTDICPQYHDRAIGGTPPDYKDEHGDLLVQQADKKEVINGLAE